MDLAKFDVRGAANQGADLHLKHPSTGKPLFCKDGKTPFTIKVLGRDADVLQQALKSANQSELTDSSDDDTRGIAVMAASIIGWSDEMVVNGELFPYSPENAIKLVSAPETRWIGEQIGPFSLSRRNYVQNMSDG